jgi:hypothetical protein
MQTSGMVITSLSTLDCTPSFVDRENGFPPRKVGMDYLAYPPVSGMLDFVGASSTRHELLIRLIKVMTLADKADGRLRLR